MTGKSKAKPRSSGRMLPILHPDAAGIDIGAEEIFVAVPPDRDIDSVCRFGTFTRDLIALADWLRQCNIRSVAMESTGVYWIPLYQILETHGFEVFLVNAHHVKNVPGPRVTFRTVSGSSICIRWDYLRRVFGHPTRFAYCAPFGVTGKVSFRWQPSIFSICRRL